MHASSILNFRLASNFLVHICLTECTISHIQLVYIQSVFYIEVAYSNFLTSTIHISIFKYTMIW